MPLPDDARDLVVLHRAYAHYIRHAHGHPPRLAATRASTAVKNFLNHSEGLTLRDKLQTFLSLNRLFHHYLQR